MNWWRRGLHNVAVAVWILIILGCVLGAGSGVVLLIKSGHFWLAILSMLIITLVGAFVVGALSDEVAR